MVIHCKTAKKQPEPPVPETESRVSDQDLLVRFVQRRDEEAFAGLVQRHSNTVWGVCQRMLQQTQDTEDAFQAVFLILARKAESIRKGNAVGSWLYGVAYRVAKKARQGRGRRQDRELQTPPLEKREQAPWSEAACRELQRIVDEEVQRLAEKFRAPFVLCCLEGMSKSEAARELGWKEGTVSGRLAQARSLLQSRLARRGISLSAALTIGFLAEKTAAAAPLLLADATAKAALVQASGAGSGLSPSAVALADGLLKSMAVTKAKIGVCLLLATTSLVAGGLLTLHQPAADVEQPLAPHAAGIVDRGNVFVPPGQRLWMPIDEQVLAVSISPDGKKLVTAGARYTLPGQLKIWDMETHKDLVTLKGMRGIRTVTHSPDGKILATGHFGGDIILRDPDTGEEQATLSGHKTGVNSLAFSPDSKRIASAGLDQIVKIWDVETKKESHVFHGHKGMVFAVAFYSSGKAIVTSGEENIARVWDLDTGKEKFPLIGHRIGIEAVAVAPNGKFLATACWDGTVKFWDAESGKQAGELPKQESGVYALAFAPGDSSRLACATQKGVISVWDVNERRPVSLPGNHTNSAWSLAFTPDGKTLASGSSDKTAKLWDVANAKEIATCDTGTPAPLPVRALAYAPDGQTVAIATEDLSIQLRSATSGELIQTLKGHEDKVTSLAFSPDGKLLASAGADKSVRLWDPALGTEKATLQGHTGPVQTVTFAPATPGLQGWLLASAGEDGTICLWKNDSDKAHATLKTKDPLAALAWAADRSYLASGGADGVIRLWQPLLPETPPRTLAVHKGLIRALAIAPNGLLASAGEDGLVKLWDPVAAVERLTLKEHQVAVWSLAFSPSGQTLVSGGHDGKVIVWDPVTGQVRKTLYGHKLAVTALAIHPEGDHLLSASLDTSVLRWQSDQLSPPPLTLDAHPGGAWFAVYSPGGDWLASGGHDRQVTIWTRSLAPASFPYRYRGGAYFDAAFAPDGRSLVVAHGNALEVHDAFSRNVGFQGPMSQSVRSVAISADGRYAAAATGNWKQRDQSHTAKIWDLKTGQELATLEGHTSVIYSVKFAPDGKTLVTSSNDLTIRVWEAPTGKFRGMLKCHARGIDFLPDGRLVAASFDKTIRFWDVHSLQETQKWTGTRALGSLAVSPDGKLLAVAEASAVSKGPSVLSVWDVAGGKELFQLEGHGQPINDVVFSRDSIGLIAAGGKADSFGEIAYWDLVSRKLRAIHKAGPQPIDRVAISPDGHRVVSASADGLACWDLDFLHKERTWQAHTHFMTCGLFVDNNTLATGSWDNTIGLWNVATGEKIASLKGHKGGLRKLALLPDRKTLISASMDGTVKLWDLKTASEKGALEGNKEVVFGLAVTHDGKTLATGGGDINKKGQLGEVILWDLATLKPKMVFPPINTLVWNVALSPDGSLVAVRDWGVVKVLEVQTGEIRASLPLPLSRSLAFSPDGKWLAIGNSEPFGQKTPTEVHVELWDTKTWKKQPVLQNHKKVVFSVDFSPDGRSLVSAAQDGTIQLARLPGPPADFGKVKIEFLAKSNKVISQVAMAKQPNGSAVAADVEDEGGASSYLRIGAVVMILFLVGIPITLALRRRKNRPASGEKPRKKSRKGHAPLPIQDEEKSTQKAEPRPEEASICFACAGCGKKLKSKSSLVGKKIKCPGCQQPLVIPAESATGSTGMPK
jgi:RNA polymerase sigma factor (sigma-70 family)